MSEVFKLSGEINIDIDNIVKQLKQVQTEGEDTEQALNQIGDESLNVDIRSAVSDLQQLESEAGETQDNLRQIGDADINVDVGGAVSDLERLESESGQTQDDLRQIGDVNVNINITNVIGDLQRVQSESDKTEDAIKNAFSFEAVSGITDKFKGIVDTIMGLSGETIELANNQAKLQSSLTTTGHSADYMRQQYSNLYGYLGDDMAVTNTILNIEKLGLSQKESAALTDSAIAVWTQYGDSIPLEGLAESIDETVMVGQVTGNLADALNWAGISEDDFNKKLEKCKTTQERAKLITDTLNKTYGESKEQYDELTKNTRDYQEAQSDLEQSQLELGQAMMPLQTAMTKLKSTIAQELIPVFENLTPVFEKNIEGINWLTEKFQALPQPIQTVITVVILIAGGLTALIGVIGIINPIIGIFTSGWGLLTGAFSAVAGFIPTLIGAIGGISAPVLIVVGVITALIAIGVALYKNWDTVKVKASEVWNAIKTVFSTVLNVIKTVINTGFNAIKNTISTIMNGIKGTVSNVWNGIKSVVSSVCGGISSVVSSKFNAVKNSISNAINGAKSVVQSGLNKIKSFFSNCNLKLPKIKLPHFKISGNLSINPPSVPKLSIDWYKKGGIMTSPTLFGINGNNFMAGGEAGDEAILPIDGFYDNLDKFLDEKLTNNQNITYNVNFNFSNIKIQNESDMEKLAKIIDQKLQQFINRKIKLNGGVTVG